MIDYDPEPWGVAFVFRVSGSVLPKALPWAIPSAALAVCLHMYFQSEGHEFEADEGIRLGIGSYNVALSLLVIFRTQQAYTRWWEGGSLLQTMRGEWYNAYSSLLSFTARNPGRRADVEAFQHLLLRVMSLLHGTALQQVSTTPNLLFELVDLRGVDARHLEFLRGCEDRCEVVMQWVQRVTVEAFEGGVLPIPAPILSRVFQGLSRGIVSLAGARKISELPFPYAYAQVVAVALMVHWALMPVLMAHLCRDAWWAGILTFVTVFWNWSLNYVAQEIESPFGEDANALPLVEMQVSFNRMLAALITQEAQEAPRFIFEKEHRKMGTTCIRSGTFPSTDDLGVGIGIGDYAQSPTHVPGTQGTEAETLDRSNRSPGSSGDSAGPRSWEREPGKRRKKRPSRYSQARSRPGASRRVQSPPRPSYENNSGDGEQPVEAEASTRSSRSTGAVSDMGFYPGSSARSSPRGPSGSALASSGANTPDSLAEPQALAI